MDSTTDSLNDSDFKTTLLWLIVGFDAAPLFILCLKQSVLAPKQKVEFVCGRADVLTNRPEMVI